MSNIIKTQPLTNMLKAVRIKHNLTRIEVADKLGIPSSTYSKYEITDVTPHKDTLYKLSKLLNLDFKLLMKSSEVRKKYKINDFSVAIIIARNEKGLTLREASILCGIPYDTFYKYELGCTQPSKKNINKISQVLDIHIEVIY